MKKRLYIKEALIDLGYKDRRSLIRWCRNNGVAVLRDIGSKRQYVLRQQYEAVMNRVANIKLNTEHVNLIHKTENYNDYLPVSSYEAQCLSRLLKKINSVP